MIPVKYFWICFCDLHLRFSNMFRRRVPKPTGMCSPTTHSWAVWTGSMLWCSTPPSSTWSTQPSSRSISSGSAQIYLKPNPHSRIFGYLTFLIFDYFGGFESLKDVQAFSLRFERYARVLHIEFHVDHWTYRYTKVNLQFFSPSCFAKSSMLTAYWLEPGCGAAVKLNTSDSTSTHLTLISIRFKAIAKCAYNKSLSTCRANNLEKISILV